FSMSRLTYLNMGYAGLSDTNLNELLTTGRLRFRGRNHKLRGCGLSVSHAQVEAALRQAKATPAEDLTSFVRRRTPKSLNQGELILSDDTHFEHAGVSNKLARGSGDKSAAAIERGKPMTRNYPNITPPNDLRLPDALTIKHGPRDLLARFVLEGDKLARAMGI